MRTFALKQRENQQMASARAKTPGPAPPAQDRDMKPIHRLQHTIGNQAVRRIIKENTENVKEGPKTSGIGSLEQYFNRTPLHALTGAASQRGSSAVPSTPYTMDSNKTAVQRRKKDIAASDAPMTTAAADQPASPAVGSPDKQNGPVADAPAKTYIVPFDRHPLAAAGERVIFRGDFTDPSPADYQLEYSTTGGHFTSATGPTTRTIAGLTSGNVDFFVPTLWDGTSTVQVVLKVKKTSDNSVTQTETWNFGLKARYPTTMTQKEGTGEKNLPGVYTYDIGPVVIPYAPPYYQHQTILERFGNWSLANIVPADIAAAYRTAHALNSTANVSQHFLGNYAGNNGTFTVNANDQIADQHGGHPGLSNLVNNLATPKDIEVALPQTYEAKPGTALGNYTVTRVLKADGTTWKVKKG